MAVSEELIGDQLEGDVIHILLKGCRVFGCYEVDGGRLQLLKRMQRDRAMLNYKPVLELILTNCRPL